MQSNPNITNSAGTTGLGTKFSFQKLNSKDEITRFYISHFVRDAFLILLGIASAGFGLKGFLIPNSFIDGGVTGISLLTEQVTGISLSILLVIIKSSIHHSWLFTNQ